MPELQRPYLALLILLTSLSVACASAPPGSPLAADPSCICDAGKAQSPIDLSPSTSAALPVLDLGYGATRAKLRPDSKVGFKVELSPAPTLTIRGEVFTFNEFHFHFPREHALAETPAAMELHFVHLNAVGEAAVVGVFLREGSANDEIQQIWNHFGSSEPFDLNPLLLLPERRQYLRYAGSLTTPPCTEGIRWHVFTEPIPISPEQVAAYRARFGRTARDPQSRNGRPVLRGSGG